MQKGIPCSSEDDSGSWSLLRYGFFIASGLTLMTYAMVVVPVTIHGRVGSCPPDSNCLSLEKDLRQSLDNNVHPCDDFYQHVCSRWDSQHVKWYGTPLDKYRTAFNLALVKKLIQQHHIPVKPKKALHKASLLLLRCLSQGSRRDASPLLKDFLKKLNLPWPHKSHTSRFQLLNILVQASLEYGIPIIWAFYVGRHPARPSENTLYLALGPHLLEWIAHVDALQQEGAFENYLRRCAEIVGGTGQSYSRMIEDVLSVHEALNLQVHHSRNVLSQPAYTNLSDPELRRAVNGHLPDKSQLWPEDEIVNLQPYLFSEFDRSHLKDDAARDRLKLFLGAYVVWVLSPYTSFYLTASLMADMKRSDATRAFLRDRCIESVTMVMPLVLWNTQFDRLKHKHMAFVTMDLLTKALIDFTEAYSNNLASAVKAITSRLSVNAFNMTMTWQMLDKAYAFIPADQTTDFFTMFLRAAMASVVFFKQSLRRPRHNIFHVPGISNKHLYRLLVGREIEVEAFMLSAPLVLPNHPIEALAGILGIDLAESVIFLLDFVFFYDNRFQSIRETPEIMVPVVKHIDVLVNHITSVSTLEGLEYSERRLLAYRSLAVSVARRAFKIFLDARTDTSIGAQHRFGNFEPDQLFYALSCFSYCGSASRIRVLQVVICNGALPLMEGFREAFHCLETHRLSRNITWILPSGKAQQQEATGGMSKPGAPTLQPVFRAIGPAISYR